MIIVKKLRMKNHRKFFNKLLLMTTIQKYLQSSNISLIQIALIFKEFMIYRGNMMEKLNVYIKFKNLTQTACLLANGYKVLSNWI